MLRYDSSVLSVEARTCGESYSYQPAIKALLGCRGASQRYWRRAVIHVEVKMPKSNLQKGTLQTIGWCHGDYVRYFLQSMCLTYILACECCIKTDRKKIHTCPLSVLGAKLSIQYMPCNLASGTIICLFYIIFIYSIYIYLFALLWQKSNCAANTYNDYFFHKHTVRASVL